MIVGPIPGATKTQEQGRKRRVRKNHFEELARLTGFLADRIAELKVLDKGEFSPVFTGGSTG